MQLKSIRQLQKGMYLISPMGFIFVQAILRKEKKVCVIDPKTQAPVTVEFKKLIGLEIHQ
jgi:hypothetical protein